MEDFNKYKIFECLSGSHAYGTNTQESDIDIRGVFIAPPEVALCQDIEQIEFKDEDKVYFEIKKFFSLLSKANPNVIEFLFTDKENIIHQNEFWNIIVDNKDLFITKNLIKSFHGFANSQLKRIVGHNKWINNPQPKEKPRQENFLSVVYNISLNEKYNKKIIKEGYIAENLGNDIFAIHSCYDGTYINKDGSLSIKNKDEINKDIYNNPNAIYKFNKEEYKKAKIRHEQYWSWKKNRNEKRALLEEKNGFDTKHAMHLIRLYRMTIEFIEKGEINVRRKDANELLEIRNGKYSYNELLEVVNNYENKIHSTVCNIPSEPNINKINLLLKNIYLKYWEKMKLI
jgi:predicted nucleotidyltransferase